MKSSILLCAAVLCMLFVGCRSKAPGICDYDDCPLIAVTADRHYCTIHCAEDMEKRNDSDMAHRCAVVCQVCGEKLDPPQWIRARIVYCRGYEFQPSQYNFYNIPVCPKHSKHCIRKSVYPVFIVFGGRIEYVLDKMRPFDFSNLESGSDDLFDHCRRKRSRQYED